MTASLAIVGCGGMGREAAAWADDAGFSVLGFLDEDPDNAGDEVIGLPVLGLAHGLEELGETKVVVAIGNPEARHRVASELIERGVELATVVHSTAVIGPGCGLGDGVIIGPNVVLTRDVTVHDLAIVNFGAVVGHDGSVGPAAFIGPNAALAGNVTVGQQAQIGLGASIVQGVVIGVRARVGAGAAVIGDVPAGATVVGVPAS